MAKINLDNYEPVEERIMRFKNDNPNFRMRSDIVDMRGDIGATRWVMKVEIWKDAANEFPDATGYAFEIDGVGMTQGSAALETCETSAYGRALANLGYVGNRRVTQEEMVKVKNNEVLAQINKATSQRELNQIYTNLKREGIEQHFLGELTRRKNEIIAEQEPPQTDSQSNTQAETPPQEQPTGRQ